MIFPKGLLPGDATYIVPLFSAVSDTSRTCHSEVARKVLVLINNGGPILDAVGLGSVSTCRLLAIPEQLAIRESLVHEDPASEAAVSSSGLNGGTQKHLGGASREKPALIRGYTTKDDISADGDDAEHFPSTSYTVPNCIQAEVGFPAEGKAIRN